MFGLIEITGFFKPANRRFKLEILNGTVFRSPPAGKAPLYLRVVRHRLRKARPPAVRQVRPQAPPLHRRLRHPLSPRPRRRSRRPPQPPPRHLPRPPRRPPRRNRPSRPSRKPRHRPPRVDMATGLFMATAMLLTPSMHCAPLWAWGCLNGTVSLATLPPFAAGRSWMTSPTMA